MFTDFFLLSPTTPLCVVQGASSLIPKCSSPVSIFKEHDMDDFLNHCSAIQIAETIFSYFPFKEEGESQFITLLTSVVCALKERAQALNKSISWQEFLNAFEIKEMENMLLEPLSSSNINSLRAYLRHLTPRRLHNHHAIQKSLNTLTDTKPCFSKAPAQKYHQAILPIEQCLPSPYLIVNFVDDWVIFNGAGQLVLSELPPNQKLWECLSRRLGYWANLVDIKIEVKDPPSYLPEDALPFVVLI